MLNSKIWDYHTRLTCQYMHMNIGTYFQICLQMKVKHIDASRAWKNRSVSYYLRAEPVNDRRYFSLSSYLLNLTETLFWFRIYKIIISKQITLWKDSFFDFFFLTVILHHRTPPLQQMHYGAFTTKCITASRNFFINTQHNCLY